MEMWKQVELTERSPRAFLTCLTRSNDFELSAFQMNVLIDVVTYRSKVPLPTHFEVALAASAARSA